MINNSKEIKLILIIIINNKYMNRMKIFWMKMIGNVKNEIIWIKWILIVFKQVIV
jgi:hypothetical protein